MNSKINSKCLAILLLSVMTLPAQAGDDWTWSSLNPFGSKKSSTSNVSSQQGSSWLPKVTMPKMPWSKPSKSASFQPKKKSTWSSFTQSSKNLWSKSTSWMIPKDTSKSPNFQSSYEKQNKPGFFQNWLYPPEEPKIETMSDFLSLPHPY